MVASADAPAVQPTPPPTPAVTTMASAPLSPPVASPPPQRGNANQAFVPPPGWTPPAASTEVAAAAPPSSARSAPVAATTVPAPEPVKQQPVVQAPVVQPPAAPPPPVAQAPVPLPPAAPIEGNIATAQSGRVPFSDMKSPPFGGNMQVAVIQFGRGSSGLGGTDMSVLQKVAEIQKTNGATVRVVAHSLQDASASSIPALTRANYEVSRLRALAIANQLVRLGVPVDRIVAEAASDSEPVYETNTARGIAANRRADIFVDF
ncbi:hypothetical protein BH11PSE3_BH11PSE3_49970 [soil metagenome]